MAAAARPPRSVRPRHDGDLRDGVSWQRNPLK
jgi:hypothetical protein